MLIRTDTLKPWQGERLAGILYPLTIEKLWSDPELAAIGLVKRKRFVVPDGQRIVAGASPTYAIDGSETYPVEDIPPPTAEQLAAEDAANVDDVVANPRMGKVLLELVNAIRDLQGKPEITADQLKTWVASL